MKKIAATIAMSALAATGAEAREKRQRVAPQAVYETAPGLGDFTDNVLFGEVWERKELSPRDRSLVTVATLVSTGKIAQTGSHVRRALDNGVKPEEIGELITQLAFYSGWPNAMSAVVETKKVFESVGSAPSPTATPRASNSKLRPKRHVRPQSTRTLRRRRRHWPISPTVFSSVTFGSVQICRPATAAW
ncbi:carboxymuconolactone decarboxylase family protein [Rhizobium favelukesii]|nr:carboxymuconolactone decarboxylase family protein [Rhizobium favelukesii]MCS0461537.1 carboxymuconolactone decarboxylase family protein [Rhizobium favelukesii]